MITIKNKETCSGCYACYNICPQRCISMENDSEGFWYPQANREWCIECNLCMSVCPNIHKKMQNTIPIAYAAYNVNESIRMDSSSGGIFTLLAEQIIDDGGVVFGAAFDKQFNVAHVITNSKEDLLKLRSSKYVQSRIGNTYQQAKELLNQDRMVLFTGTPCQIGGLKSFLGQDYDNLVCQDIICQGVPSPKAWQKYLTFIINKVANGASLKKVTFRSKEKSWNQYAVQIYFEDGQIYYQAAKDNLYMKAFLKCISLRPSCYKCAFKSQHNRESDITLADFWGIKDVASELDDNKGTSLVLINSSKGQRVFEKINEKVVTIQVDFNQAISHNPMYMNSAPVTPLRGKFFRKLHNRSFDEVIKIVLRENILTKIYRRTINTGKKLLD